ncbi:hypothetical protein C8R44DRAFT_817155 [Mycena epipterygia]|nr:hypothetical protein C8R44DRAFT_817155 [Mycena epipterygia]
MVSFAQFLDNSGIHLEPGVFIGIIAGGLVFIIVLVIAVVYVHRRNKRLMMAGAFDKSAFTVVSFTHPRPPLPTYHQSSPRSSLIDREAQQQDLVGREVRQQEQTYMQLMMDLQRPVSRAGTPSLPSQTPREVPYHLPRMVQRDPTQVALPQSPFTALYPVVAPVPTPPPVATLSIPDGKATQLKRGLSIRSLDSASEYSVASAPRDGQEPTYQSFTLGLSPVPASPSTPKWPSSPGSYVWPKRQRASQIRKELAPETYAKVRWITDDETTETAAVIPVALPPAPRSVSSPTSPGPALRINVPPPVHYRTNSDSPASASTAQLFCTNASATSSSPTLPSPQPRSPQRPF